MKNHVDRGGCYPPRLELIRAFMVFLDQLFFSFCTYFHNLFLQMVDDILIDANIM